MTRGHKDWQRPLISITKYLSWQPGRHLRRVFRNTCHSPEKFQHNQIRCQCPWWRGPARWQGVRTNFSTCNHECSHEGRILFWLHGMTFLICLYGIFPKIFKYAKRWKPKKHTANGYKASISGHVCPQSRPHWNKMPAGQDFLIHLWNLEQDLGFITGEVHQKITF